MRVEWPLGKRIHVTNRVSSSYNTFMAELQNCDEHKQVVSAARRRGAQIRLDVAATANIQERLMHRSFMAPSLLGE